MQLIKPQIIGMEATPDRLTLHYGQRVGAILNQNEIDRRNSDDNWKQDADMKLVGRIPKSIYILWKQAGILDDENELHKALERNPIYKTTEKTLV